MITLRIRATKMVLCAVILLALRPSPALALPDEYLFCDPPRGWGTATSSSTPREAFTEMRPEGEKANGWSQIITVQTLIGRFDILPSR
jgi:hypothetical protein